MPQRASAGTTDDSQTRSVSHAPRGVAPKRRASFADNASICDRRSRYGIAASTGSASPAPNISTCPRATITRRSSMSSG
jgi:hypothetical protein